MRFFPLYHKHLMGNFIKHRSDNFEMIHMRPFFLFATLIIIINIRERITGTYMTLSSQLWLMRFDLFLISTNYCKCDMER